MKAIGKNLSLLSQHLRELEANGMLESGQAKMLKRALKRVTQGAKTNNTKDIVVGLNDVARALLKW